MVRIDASTPKAGQRLITCAEASANKAAIVKQLKFMDVCNINGGEVTAVTVMTRKGFVPTNMDLTCPKKRGAAFTTCALVTALPPSPPMPPGSHSHPPPSPCKVFGRGFPFNHCDN